MDKFHRDTSVQRLRIHAKNRLILMRRCALYLQAGIPIIETIDLIAADTYGQAEARMLSLIAKDIRHGLPLSQALSSFPRVYQPLHVRLVMAGEASGTLVDSLNHLSDILARRAELHRKILSALAYPVVILCGTISVSSFLIFYAFPKIVPLFRGLHTTLPLTTRSLIWVSALVKDRGLILLGIASMLAAGITYLLRIPKLRVKVDHILLRIPMLGSTLQRYYLATIFRILSVLLKSGVRINVALAHAQESVSHAAYKESLAHVERTVLEGGRCATGLRAFPKAFPTTAVQLIAAGEMTGTLAQSALALAELFEEELEGHTRALSSLLEPLLMIVMGLVVGFVALAIISPMYSLTQNLSAH